MIRELTTYEFTCHNCKARVVEQQVKFGGPAIPKGWSWEDIHGCGLTGYSDRLLRCEACTWQPQVGDTVRRKGHGPNTKGRVLRLVDGDLPVFVRFEDGSESSLARASVQPAPYECPQGHADVIRLDHEIADTVHEALRCKACPANYVQLVGGRWFQAP